RTISSAFTFEEPDRIEDVVAAVVARRDDTHGLFEYETHWAAGDVTWQQAQSFLDDDGTINYKWLQFAEEEDIRALLMSLTNERLEDICSYRSLKVVSRFLILCFPNPHNVEKWKKGKVGQTHFEKTPPDQRGFGNEARGRAR